MVSAPSSTRSCRVGAGITSTLRDVVRTLQLRRRAGGADRTGAEITPVLAHEGNSWSAGLDLKDLL